MLSKAKIKYIRSLELKKFRNTYKTFVAEGNKLVEELLFSFDCELLVAKSSWMATQGHIPTKELLVADDGDIEKVSFLKSPQDVIAVFNQPHYLIDSINPEKNLILMLDGVQDPGNLGTIIRVADWFGIEDIVCSPDTADVFSPKTVQATMGALAHVKVHYTELTNFLEKQNSLVYGTFLDGENFYKKELNNTGFIVMGNEGNGVRPEVASFINQRLYIPHYPAYRETTESLNVAVATAIVCGEFRRRLTVKEYDKV
ncbi:MAG: TrmH family RNA methyltransferase [Massilibacteroides sp.]|nr:TrmH family RNA methyltransferase [Massilibacteroides sp.]MDD3061392.1 TrmH family RNA methyltransferase [Massilibacteroides sp.]MDD4115016.1 TrmH family RNA methyltransferase [Massilibacteroides sp.]MDD4659483.1 TrmH family RNA methyltransferase [Massilibacteroides sp.]